MGKQDLRRIGHLDQPLPAHLEYTDLERGAKTVLDTAQNAVDIVVVPLEL